MAPKQLENLAERLLRAGVAPRHVRRYLRELREHYDDILQAELERGASRAEAQATASTRLGSADDLASSVLARPELRSPVARCPYLFFGAGPVLLWFGCLGLTFCGIRILSGRVDEHAGWLLPCAYALCIAHVRVLPIVLGAVALGVAFRHRSNNLWPVVGATIVSMLAGTISVNLMPDSEQLGMSSALLPFLVPTSKLFGHMDTAALAAGLARSIGMLAVSMAAYLLWRRRVIARPHPLA